MFASLIFVTQKEHPVAKPLTFKMRQTTHTADIPNQCCRVFVDICKARGVLYKRNSQFVFRLICVYIGFN